MAAALLSKDENTVLIFAGQIMSKRLNNAALIASDLVGLTSHASFSALTASHLVGLTSHASFSIQLKIFPIGFSSADCGGHSLWCLTGTQMGVAGP